MQDPKKPKKKRMYRLHDDPIPTDPDEFAAYQAGEYDEEPFIDYWNRKGAALSIENAKSWAEKRSKEETEKAKTKAVSENEKFWEPIDKKSGKEKERQKALLAAKSARSGKSVGKFAADATRVKGS